jgi:UDP-2-acetamido-2-deoxy-ribo-hexuluronate aminotransferase
MQFNDLQAQHARYALDIERRMQSVFAHARFIMGPEVAELESALAEFVAVPQCVTVGSGTQALEIALRALGVGPGDEVITTTFSWISSAEVIALVGATPVFVDIEPRGFGLDPQLLTRAITPRTKAVLPVSLYGQPPDLSAIAAIAEAHGLDVIEDGAQSFGARQRGRRSGALTRIGGTSFFPSKPLGCYGDGGALFTSDADLAKRCRAIRTHGSEDRKEHSVLGMNARLDTLQAAVLLAKLPHFEAEVARRRQLAARYSEALERYVTVPAALPETEHVFAQYTLRHPERDQLARALAEQGIPTQIHYARCLHQQPVFAGLARGPLPEAERAAREVLSLPLHASLSDAQQTRIIEATIAAVSGLAAT